MLMAVLWDVVPCSLLDEDRRFRVLTASIIAFKMKALRASETSVNVYKTTLRNIPEDSHLNTRCRENRNLMKRKFGHAMRRYIALLNMVSRPMNSKRFSL
jgi:hypothetical protein